METKNPILCDPETGFCEIPGINTNKEALNNPQVKEKTVRLVYFTDPICSSCWGIEGQLRKLKLEYGHELTIDYRMGGLLPSFDNNYNSGGITKPADVAVHWDHASDYYQMPIDGNVWLEDPLSSSYPPSIAFKAAQLQSEEKAVAFLRSMREMLFLQKKNISKWEVLAEAARLSGLDITKLKDDYEGKAQTLFQEDLNLSREMGVRGFPTIYFFNDTGLQEVVSGSKPYESYEKAILKSFPEVKRTDYSKDALELVHKFGSITIKELSVLAEISMSDAEKELLRLQNENKLAVIVSRKGNLWRLKE
ncbi:putative DsbA family dithiol-disulfide isomerase [Dysgonomonas alginatilytica]|uniref:Putative DsbA family dithiol-disulfide isomerase n=1 Tax=Dysgonomonas alginatilytica TaxID=1605892 RepID=A0A2V3PKK0_9BACT|nr:ClpXP adapter SpxH family protein [Dysgonomonas alginatilytica]PXV61983.1 putative DsbA family dithiol-disulfide isomerase [Dysgonomonas alginatilytica]